MSKETNTGFTALELIVFLAAIGILVSLVIFLFI